ncbi:MAG: tRNA guanosine(15) transglycosylase TgtA [Candidatus Altiarchaeota archaeon]
MNSLATFDIKQKDLAGRIGNLELNGKKLETPILLPVYHPGKPTIPLSELQSEFKLKALMTNAYMLLKDEKVSEKVKKKGLHKFLNFPGLIATDSGSFQLMTYGAVQTNNREIIDFEEKIGSDIGSFLDIPSLPDAFKPRAAEQMAETLKRAKEAVSAKFLVNAGVQGAKYLDLRKKCAQELSGDFQLLAVGGIVKLMEDYRFAELVDVIATVKKNIPTDRIVHAFGLGHPMVFSLAAALGCDIFDSAAYALFAQQDRYMTSTGTKHLEELDYLPCSCPVCSKHGLELKSIGKDERIKELARHNLYVSFEEIRRVKQATREGNLWELVALRARSHPALMGALKALEKHTPWMAELDPISKGSPLYHTGEETSYRPEVLNAKKRLERVGSENIQQLPFFGGVPLEVSDLYPFGSAFLPQEDEQFPQEARITDLQKIRAIADYQFGKGAGELIPDKVRIKKSRKTKRIRWIYLDKEMIASVRASDHIILPKQRLAEKLLEEFKTPKLRVILQDDKEAIDYVKEGLSVFCKFVKDVDPELRCQDECLIVDEKDNLLKIGTLALSPKEIKDFNRGMAVRVR